jgi:cytochrome c peroxidase
MLSNKHFLVFFVVTIFFLSFINNNNHFYITIPKGFPNPEIPEDNELNKERIHLGKKLFFDKILSRDSSISCASCHKPEYAFTDGLKKAVGIKNRSVIRNTPTLTNIVYNKNFLRDGVNPSLEAQVLVPIHEKNEFDFHILLVAERLKKKPEYLDLFEKAYGGIPTPKLITKAIACYERTLISGNSRYDQYVYQNKNHVLSSSEKKGMDLFNKLYCVSCHSGFNFSNGEIVNNGLYEKYEDVGKMRVSLNEIDNGCFKVPTLRNIALTAPYMHDGSLQTLEEVIDHYMKGGNKHPNKHPFIKPFMLSKSDRKNLVSFLRSLTDSSFTVIH